MQKPTEKVLIWLKRRFLYLINLIGIPYSRIRTDFLTCILRKRIARGQRDICWCGGKLVPFKWHRSYGECIECGCYVSHCPPSNPKELYSYNFYWHTMQKYHSLPTIESRAELYKRDGRLDYWLELIRRYGPGKGRAIEVGCAPGALLAELQRNGYECIGVEPDQDTAFWIEQNMKVDMRVGLFPDIDLPECDLFLAFDVLEHSHSPDCFMQKVSRILNPGGIAIVQTPIDRYNYRPPFGNMFKYAFNELEHIFIFTEKAINILSERYRLEIVTLCERPGLHEICILRKL